jgi:hypothetical protein
MEALEMGCRRDNGSAADVFPDRYLFRRFV